jgi:photosystem II stability/assembly factor-like uncharacterized protein
MLVRVLILFVLFTQAFFPQAVHWELIYSNIFDLKATSEGNLYFTTYSNIIYKSSDWGNSWTQLNVGGILTKLTVDSDDVIYAASVYYLTPGIYKSTDYGETWNFYSSSFRINSLTTDKNNFLYAGGTTGGFQVTTDKGVTWDSSLITDKKINSITVSAEGQLFAATEGKGLFTSSDTGSTWTRITDTTLADFLYSTVSDSNYVYVSSMDKVFRSGDNGNSWQCVGTFPPSMYLYDNPGLLNVRSDSELYYLSGGIYRSTDQGSSWEFLFGPYLPQFYSIIFSGSKIFLGTSLGIYRHDPDYQVYSGECYYPLAVGNKWQYFTRDEWYGQGNYYYNYGTRIYEIFSDTLIGTDLYFKNKFGYIRSSKRDKKVYYFTNGSSKVYLDFGLPSGNNYLQTNAFNYSRNVLSTDRYATILGTNTHLEGYRFEKIAFEKTVITEEFAENLGLVYHKNNTTVPYGPGSGVYTEELISAILYDSIGVAHHYSTNHKPQVKLPDTVSVSSGPFTLQFSVSHAYSKTWSQFGIPKSFNFIDTVKIESFYQKDDSVVIIPAKGVFNSELLNYSFTTYLDTALLKNLFTYNYRIRVIDKYLIPGETLFPSEGYFQCVWGEPVDVVDLPEIPFEFSLFQNYPNPFNPVTNIKFILPEKSNVQLKLFDLLGKEIRILESGYLDAGVHNIEFNAAGLSSGMYIYQLVTESHTESKKMIVLK